MMNTVVNCHSSAVAMDAGADAVLLTVAVIPKMDDDVEKNTKAESRNRNADGCDGDDSGDADDQK